jgi:predicted transcriptional regulator
MRTTLTLDDDVAAHLDRLRARGDRPFKELVNETLFAGLVALESASLFSEPASVPAAWAQVEARLDAEAAEGRRHTLRSPSRPTSPLSRSFTGRHPR